MDIHIDSGTTWGPVNGAGLNLCELIARLKYIQDSAVKAHD